MTTTMALVAWNGTAVSLDNIFVDKYDTEPLYAEDGMVPYGQQTTVSGTAVIPAGNEYATFLDALKNGSNRLTSAVVYVGSVKLAEMLKTQDDNGGPYCKLTTNEVVGFGCAMMRFELVQKRSFVENQTAVAHTWTQSMVIDADGSMTRTINGHLRIARSTLGDQSTLASVDDWRNRKNFVDLFRFAITPNVPGEGWRRERQEFALDATSTMLIYSLVDKRNVSDLPDGVRVGDMEFTYERSAENQNLATVRFSCDLQGDLSLKDITGTTGNRRLVEAAIALSKTRMNLNYGRSIVNRFVVTEKHLLSGFSVHFELDALTVPLAASSDNPAVVGNIATMAYMIGNKFQVTRTVRRAVDAYGPVAWDSVADKAVSYAFVPHFLNNALSGMEKQSPSTALNMPYATTFYIEGANPFGTVQVYVISNADGVYSMNSSLGGQYLTQQTQPNDNSGGYLSAITTATSLTSTKHDSGLVRLTTMYVDQPDLVLQIRKPVAIVTEHTETGRVNQAPAKSVRALPTGAYLLGEHWDVTYGQFDAQGNRVFTGVYDRTYAVYDTGATSTVGFQTATVPTGQVRTWGAPNQVVLPTLSPIAQLDLQTSSAPNVFANGTDPYARYGVARETYAT